MSDGPVDLQDLLNKPMSEYPDMPNLPGAKHFYGKITGVLAGNSRQKGTPYYRFQVRLTDPGDDVTKEELDKIANAGFSLSDYEVYADMWLTPNSMRMLRRFVESLGFPPNASFRENLKLDDAGMPTAETLEAVRGLDVFCRTQAADDNGRVYSNLDTISGVKK